MHQRRAPVSFAHSSELIFILLWLTQIIIWSSISCACICSNSSRIDLEKTKIRSSKTRCLGDNVIAFKAWAMLRCSLRDYSEVSCDIRRQCQCWCWRQFSLPSVMWRWRRDQKVGDDFKWHEYVTARRGTDNGTEFKRLNGREQRQKSLTRWRCV